MGKRSGRDAGRARSEQGRRRSRLLGYCSERSWPAGRRPENAGSIC